MRSSYGQFCPVALGAEAFAERWTPLIIRELLSGSSRFCDLQRGLPGVSRNLLTQRLGQLARAGVIERASTGDGPRYRLTEAGAALEPVIRALGEWGWQQAARELRPEHLNAELLMWFLRRRVITGQLPDRLVVVRFRFRIRAPRRVFWLLLRRDGADLCVKDPGFEMDLDVDADLEAMTRVYLGQLPLSAAIRSGAVELTGSRAAQRGFSRWLGISPFATLAAVG